YLTLVLTILGHSLFGQGWEFRYTQEDERYFVEDAIVDQDSSVYLVGRRSYYDPNGPYLQYAFMAKFSSTGSLDWIEDYPTGFIPQQYSTVLYETNPRSVVFEINDAGNLYLAFLNRGAAINEYEMVILEVNRSDGSMVFLNNTPFSPQNYTPNVIRKGEDDNFLVAGPILGEDQDLFLRSYSVDGTLQWQSTYDLIPETHLYKVAIPIGDTEFIGQIFEKTPEGNYLLGASVYNSNDPSACYLQIVELNPNGNLEQVIDFAPYSMSANEVTDQILSIDVLHDNTFAVFRVSNHSTTNSAYYLTYFDDSGTVAWERTFADISEPTLDTLPKGNTFTNGLLVHPNNDLSYVTTSDSLLHVITIDQNGSALATQTYPFLEGPSLDSEGYLKATEDQGMIWFGTTEDRRAIIYKFGSDGSLEWKNRSTLNNLMSGVMTHILSLDDQSHILIIPENHALVGPSINAIKIDASGIIFENQLTGQVFADIDENCLLDSTDILLQNQILQLDHEFFGVHYVSTDATGSFQFGLPDGDFSLSLNNVGLAWDFCFGNPVTGSLGTGADTLLLDFPLFPIADCPELSVELYTSSIRNCNPGTYSVRYCNIGTIPAVDAYIEISFHDSLTIDSASIPWSNQVGNTFTFPVDTIGLWSCEEFVVHFTAPCNVDLIGQSFCSEAHIYPDTLCGANPEPYTGAFMEAHADCQDSVLYFFLENTGQSPTSQEIEYVIIEDAVLQMSDQMNFDPDQEEVIEVPPTGSTYWLIADQEPGAPGAAQPIIGVEGCTNGDPLLITTGILNQFPYNDADPYLDIDCSIFRTAYNHNDKVASPV
ncbi:MAG: hypothetical protein KDC44_06145, partial [Phaeodactylibacter sp.]|nr:hypothetical protein [Phaeodactylibacter sp.]